MSQWREVGPVVRLQIQRKSLKPAFEREGRRPFHIYIPDPILSTDALEVSDSLVTAEEDGQPVIDVHCASHPESRNRGNGNMLSVLFTSHYEKMRERFGERITNGIAGENILVETDEYFNLEDVQAGIRIEGEGGRSLEFGKVIVATPCLEYSRFCLGDPEAAPKLASEALKFLDLGTRGYYCFISNGMPTRLELGDRLFVRS